MVKRRIEIRLPTNDPIFDVPAGDRNKIICELLQSGRENIDLNQLFNTQKNIIEVLNRIENRLTVMENLPVKAAIPTPKTEGNQINALLEAFE